jgi:hypothetical protein
MVVMAVVVAVAVVVVVAVVVAVNMPMYFTNGTDDTWYPCVVLVKQPTKTVQNAEESLLAEKDAKIYVRCIVAMSNILNNFPFVTYTNGFLGKQKSRQMI